METLGRHGRWVEIGGVAEVEPGGSVSTYASGRREVYHFGWLPGEDGPGVWRSRAGVDEEIGAYRATTALGGFERLADLTEGDYHLNYRRPGMTTDVPLRIRLKRER